jgi:hypothetical protein
MIDYLCDSVAKGLAAPSSTTRFRVRFLKERISALVKKNLLTSLYVKAQV